MAGKLDPHKARLVVVGGGAAGFFCAINAARHSNLNVILLERSSKLLSKVKISGGGRCNVTHQVDRLSELLQGYPRGAAFLKKSFGAFPQQDTVAWFAEQGVELVAEADGRMFPRQNTSQAIIDVFLRMASRYEVDIRMNTAITGISPRPSGGYRLQTATGQSLEAEYVCLACGGFPKSESFDWLRQLDLNVIPPVPSLFTFNMPKHPITALSGVSVPQATVSIEGSRLQSVGPLLITHWGLSGPAVLKLSSLAARELAERDYRFRVVLRWLPGFNDQTLRGALQDFRLQLKGQKLANRNPFQLPARLWAHLLQTAGIDAETRWADLSAAYLHQLVRVLLYDTMEVSGKTTFKDEFVTSGGIDLAEVDPLTMECRKHPGLHVAGEIMDVDGITGGYNFQHAWTSGWLAAQAVVKKAARTEGAAPR